MPDLTQTSEEVLVSIVIPTKNEELTIERFINWVQTGFTSTGVKGEIILLDNSDDQTPQIAKRMGARVYRPSKLGLGIAYREAVDLIRGKFVILGDADCTYDFRDIGGFLTALQSHDFVMGNRFGGYIEPKSMPFHHRYFGTPLTSWILKSIHKLDVSDVHCGMRAMSTSLYKKLPFDEPGWEYAPEMVIRACQLARTYTEIPIRFLKAPSGRLSHFKRGSRSWFEPFRAGIGAVRVSLTLGLDRVTESVGKLLLVISSIPVILIALHPIVLFGVTYSTITQVLFAMFGLTGNLMNSIGAHLKEFYKLEADRLELQEFRKALNHRFQQLFLLLVLIAFATMCVLCIFLWWVFPKSGIFEDFMRNFAGFIILLIYMWSLTVQRILINIMSKYLTQAKLAASSHLIFTQTNP